MTYKVCRHCDAVIPGDVLVCPECGASASHDSKGFEFTLVLAIFLGWLGVHKFYLGQWFQGLIYLSLSWTFIPFVLVAIDVFRYVFMGKVKFAQKYST